MSWGLDGHPHTFRSWLFAWEQKLRRLPSVRDWARANGYPVRRHGRIPRDAIKAYRRYHHVLTPGWLYRRARRSAGGQPAGPATPSM